MLLLNKASLVTENHLHSQLRLSTFIEWELFSAGIVRSNKFVAIFLCIVRQDKYLTIMLGMVVYTSGHNTYKNHGKFEARLVYIVRPFLQNQTNDFFKT